MMKEGASGSCSNHSSNRDKQKQLTIFYDGRVCVTDVTELQARAILYMASRKMKGRVMKPPNMVSQHQHGPPGPPPPPVLPPPSPPPQPALSQQSITSTSGTTPNSVSRNRSLSRFLHERQHRIHTSPYSSTSHHDVVSFNFRD